MIKSHVVLQSTYALLPPMNNYAFQFSQIFPEIASEKRNKLMQTDRTDDPLYIATQTRTKTTFNILGFIQYNDKHRTQITFNIEGVRIKR